LQVHSAAFTGAADLKSFLDSCNASDALAPLQNKASHLPSYAASSSFCSLSCSACASVQKVALKDLRLLDVAVLEAKYGVEDLVARRIVDAVWQ
jgi:hypothetical protein